MAETNTIIKRLMPFAGHPRSRIHGPAHWARVHRFGQALSEHLDLSRDGTQCVAVFAWTHDLARIDDGGGNQHAHDGASLLDPAWATVFPDLSVEQVELVRTAVRYHSDGLTAEAAYYHGYFDHLGHDDDECDRSTKRRVDHHVTFDGVERHRGVDDDQRKDRSNDEVPVHLMAILARTRQPPIEYRTGVT